MVLALVAARDVRAVDFAVEVQSGGSRTCALTGAGGVKCWGDGATTPTGVVGLTSGVSAISIGYEHVCALTDAGGVKCWGRNQYGQLGDGTTTDRPTPVDVSGLTSGVEAIAAGGAHTCALTAASGVKCWGSIEAGQLGNGVATPGFPWGFVTPVDVTGLTTGAAAIATGAAHTCALTTAGALKCWGSNSYGQLGDGTTTLRSTPVEVSGLSSGVARIATGGAHSCAVTDGGGLKCWGQNFYGQLGDGTTTDRLTAIDVNGASSGVAAVWTGGGHTCALTSGGGLKCWGQNSYGQLGDGTKTGRLTAIDPTGLTSGVVGASAGEDYTCAVTAVGGVKCWGGNWSGQLGIGSIGAILPSPVDVDGLVTGATAVGAGEYHSCALAAGGGVKCWGSNDVGQLGDGTTSDRLAPVDVSGMTGGVTGLAVGERHGCALTVAGGLKCWGRNDFGQLGDGTATDRLAPVDVNGLTSGVTAITAGYAHSCALTALGGVKCWGGYGLLGDGTAIGSPTPVDVSGLTSGVAAVWAGSFHTCALTASGAAKCWGYNENGQLGDGTTTDRLTPVDVSGLTSGVTAVRGGWLHSCARTAAGGAKCWGRNGSGELGDGTTTNRLTPVDVSGLSSGVVTLSLGHGFTCAVTAAGAAQCWGFNANGSLGDGTTMDRLTPVDVSGLSSGVATVASGGAHACALTDQGGVKCWGNNGSGQLGNGESWEITTPRDTLGFPFCGDGIPQAGEDCDDGNAIAGDCCSSTCEYEPANSPCPDANACNGAETCDGAGACQPGPPPACDDGDACTQDSCDPSTGCESSAEPAPACLTGWGKAALQVNEIIPGREKLIATLSKGPAFGQNEIGTPLVPAGPAYTACLYDDGGALAGRLEVDRAGASCAGKPCWKAITTKGYLYKDKLASADGVQLLQVLGGAAGKSKIVLKAGNNSAKGQLDLPTGISAALAGSTSATLQIHGTDAPVCFSATLGTVLRSTGTFFKAK